MLSLSVFRVVSPRCSSMLRSAVQAGGRSPVNIWTTSTRQLSWLPRKEVRTIPNMITTARILASPLLGYAVATDMKITALVGCVVFGITDWVDGYLARKLNQQTALGAFLDPLADKAMICSLSGGLVYQGLFPWQLFAMFLVRDVASVATVFILRGLEKPKDADFFDTIDTATFQVIPSDISKINTALQFTLLGATLSHFAFEAPSMAVLEPMWWITATTTLWSGLGYADGSGIKRLRGKMAMKKQATSNAEKDAKR